MRRPHKLLITALIIGLLTSIAVCYGATTISVLYQKFNDEIWKNYQLDKQYIYTNIDVKNLLIYNETTGGDPSAKVAFTNDTGDVSEGIQLLLMRSGELQIYKIEGTNEVKIATATWTKGNITRITFSEGYVSIWANYGTKESKKIIDDFAFNNFIEYTRVKGGGSFIAIDGYVQVEVGAGGAGMQSVVFEFLPVIIAFACLGIAVGMIKKYS